MRNNLERSSGAGFTDWHRKAREHGLTELAELTARMDSNSDDPSVNAHRAIAERLADYGLPIQRYAAGRIGEFVRDPNHFFEQIPDGDYYFVSIVPGVHLAHGSNSEQVIEFVNTQIKHDRAEISDDTELYLSHNGEPVISGHIIVKDDGLPNTIYGEFTIGNFNNFHRGFSSPEVTVRRQYHRFEWEFRDRLLMNGDNEPMRCNGDVWLTRTEIALRALRAIELIPHSEDYYMPGYYEVLLEKCGQKATKAAFIEANLSYRD